MEQLIIGGQNSGEFVDVEPSFVQRAVNGVLFETVREQGGPNGPVRHARPLQAGDFVLRAVLVDPAALSAVRETTRRRLDDLEGAAVG
jgi:hypothetical protein